MIKKTPYKNLKFSLKIENKISATFGPLSAYVSRKEKQDLMPLALSSTDHHKILIHLLNIDH